MATLAGARVIVTGASGFIGRHLADALAQRGAHVVALVRRPPAAGIGTADVRVVDLADSGKVRAEVRRADAAFIVHLAGLRVRDRPGLDGLRESYDVNLLATLNLAEAALESGQLRRFVYLGSAEEYGRSRAPFLTGAREAPLSWYGLSKLAATQLLQSLSMTERLPIAILRATVVYGPWQRPGMFVPALIQALLSGEKFPMTAGKQTRDLLYVDDVVRGILCALDATAALHEVLNLSSGGPVSIRAVALLVAKLIGGDAESLLEFGGLPTRLGEADEYWADWQATQLAIGWTPSVSLEDGLRLTIADYRRARAL